MCPVQVQQPSHNSLRLNPPSSHRQPCVPASLPALRNPKPALSGLRCRARMLSAAQTSAEQAAPACAFGATCGYSFVPTTSMLSGTALLLVLKQQLLVLLLVLLVVLLVLLLTR